MILLMTVIFIILVFLNIFLRNGQHKKIFNFFGFVFFCIAAFRGEGLRDYSNYVAFFDNIDDLQFIELSFTIISKCLKLFNLNVLFLFIIYASLGVYLKLFGIRQLSEFWLLSLLLYFCYSFPLHEMTQIRAGVALGFVLLSIKPLYDRKLILFFIFISLATFFHYSSSIIILVLFLDTKNINKKIWMFLIPVSYLISILGYSIYNLFSLIPIEQFAYKIEAYQGELESAPLNIFNAWLILRIIVGYLLLSKIELISSKNVYSIILLKMYIISICVIPLLSINPVFAQRISDLFSIVDIILIPTLLYIFSSNLFAKVLIIMFGFSYFFLNMFYIGIFTIN